MIVLESNEPCESLELLILRIGLETTELRVDNEMQIATVVGCRSDAASELWRAGFEALLRRGFDYTHAFHELAVNAELRLADAELSHAELAAPLMSAR